jgi:peptide/nickel transport system substrate-binding protein
MADRGPRWGHGRTRTSIVALAVASVIVVSPAAGAPTQTPRRGGTVVVALTNQPACLNGFLCDVAGIYGPVLEGAFELGPGSTFRPRLVSSVDRLETPLTLTYHIRKEARWSDGVPITSADFVFSFRVASSLPPELREAIHVPQVVDAKTVKVRFRQGKRYADWKKFLFDIILPRHALVGEDLLSGWQTAIDNPKTGRPIGSGPFLVESWERDRELTLVRNPRYWGAHTAYLSRIVFRFVPVGDQADALRRGDVDVITGPGAEGLIRDTPAGIRFFAAPGAAWDHFAIRIGGGGHDALESKLVRQALAYGINRLAIVRALNTRFANERGAVRRVLNSVVYPTRSPFYRANWEGYRYRPNEARRLLERFGCRRGSDGIYACDGEPLSLRFLTTAGRPLRQATLELVQQQLARIGIRVKSEYAPSSAVFEQVLKSGDFDVVLLAWANDGVLGPYYTFRCGGLQNYTGYCSRLVTRDLVRLSRIEPGRRAALQNRIDVKLSKDVPAIPLYENPALLAMKRTVRNVVANPGGDVMWNAEEWWLER